MSSAASHKRRRAFGRSTLFLALAVCAVLVSRGAHAADYNPPSGFNGHPWGAPLSSFRSVKLLTANTAAAPGRVTAISEFDSTICSGYPCLTPSVLLLAQREEGAGTHALAEYYFDSEPHPWPHTGIDVYTVSYLFCAHSLVHLPSPIKNYLRLCGSRVMFHSDSLAQLATHPDKYESNYDRIVHQLISEFGPPPNYQRRARIVIDANGEELSRTPVQAQYLVHRWCGLEEVARSLRPTCPATVTVVFNESSGVGAIIYATAPVYEYAWARHVGGDENNELYVVLNSPRLETPYRRSSQLHTSRIADLGIAAMSSKESAGFQP